MAATDLNERPLSEIYREAGMRWADLDAAARMLEETRTAVFSQRLKDRLEHGTPVSKAEHQVRGSDAWADYIDKMVRARTQANRAKVELEFARMQFWERNSAAATERQEMRMTT